MRRRYAVAGLFLCASVWLMLGCALPKSATVEALDQSPRHHEWAEVDAGGHQVHTFVAYPQADRKTPAVIVIHENRGLTDWERGFADQLAAAGYLAVAPDLLSGSDATHAKTSDFPSADAAREAIYKLDEGRVTRDLLAVRRYAASLPSCNGQVVVVGFCWGGTQSFRLATNAEGLSAACVFYGTAPADEAALRRIAAPVYGFYGGNDQRVNATIPVTEAAMQKAGKRYEPVIYPGAGHAFMRLGEAADATPENVKARAEAWARIKAILAPIQ